MKKQALILLATRDGSFTESDVAISIDIDQNSCPRESSSAQQRSQGDTCLNVACVASYLIADGTGGGGRRLGRAVRQRTWVDCVQMADVKSETQTEAERVYRRHRRPCSGEPLLVRRGAPHFRLCPVAKCPLIGQTVLCRNRRHCSAKTDRSLLALLPFPPRRCNVDAASVA